MLNDKDGRETKWSEDQNTNLEPWKRDDERRKRQNRFSEKRGGYKNNTSAT